MAGMKTCRWLRSLALVWLTPFSQAACEAPEPTHPVSPVSGVAPSPAPSPAPAPSPVPPASVKISFTYHEAASIFEILENTSNWWEGKCDIEYRDDWKKRFGLTIDDEKRFYAYQDIRKRNLEH